MIALYLWPVFGLFLACINRWSLPLIHALALSGSHAPTQLTYFRLRVMPKTTPAVVALKMTPRLLRLSTYK